MRFDMSDGSFPLLTSKRVFFKAIVIELLWFLRGDTNIKYLQENGITIWDEWADEVGNLGPVYGKQWRSWQGYKGHIDQIANLIHGLKKDPHGRRHIVSAWNPADIPNMALPPCHCLFQFYVGDDERLSLQLYQRSADIFLGVPFNIASYALLLKIVAAMIGREVGDFIHTFGDVHLYEKHVEPAKQQLSRQSRSFPQLIVGKDIKDFPTKELINLEYKDFKLVNYDPHPKIEAEVSK